MIDRERALRAQRRVAALKGFYAHLFIYGAVVAGLLVLNAVTKGGWWVQWVFLGWGIGVAFHALATFWRTPQFIGAWEKKKLRQLAERS